MTKPDQNARYASVKRFMADFFPENRTLGGYKRDPIKLIDFKKGAHASTAERDMQLAGIKLDKR